MYYSNKSFIIQDDILKYQKSEGYSYFFGEDSKIKKNIKKGGEDEKFNANCKMQSAK